MSLAAAQASPRPVLRWHGGKWRLAPWIIAHFPAHRVYVEPFGGAASVLLRKPRTYTKIYNDLDEDAVNLFDVLRSDSAPSLIDRLRLTPFARLEFEHAYAASDDPVERARALIVRSFMGFGSGGHNAANGRTGFRANSNRSASTPAHNWVTYPDSLATVVERLRGVVIECRPAAEVVERHDSAETLHYVDPPYLPETRSVSGKKGKDGIRVYRHEMTRAEHSDLLDRLRRLRGMVVLSGYPSALYDATLRDWHRVATEAFADGARPRTEVLWLNPASVEELERAHVPLLARATARATTG